MSIIIRKTTTNWFRQWARPSIELMRGYVQSVEGAAEQSIEAYRAGKRTEVVPHEPDDGSADVYDVYGELDGQTWDLKHLFEEYFPNMQRWGALVSLFTFFETELEDLCALFVHESGLTVTVKDLKGQGAERAMQYLTKVVGLQFDPTNDTWREIRTIQKIRNMIVHHFGKYAERDDDSDQQVVAYIQNSSLLSYADEVTLAEGFLSHLVSLIDSHLGQIDDLIRRRHST